ncbi:hypothetical protein HZS_1280 [Henneguya salminicola]|nr:hypothetical protein HZS_1280 [Henneguya salminicola]
MQCNGNLLDSIRKYIRNEKNEEKSDEIEDRFWRNQYNIFYSEFLMLKKFTADDMIYFIRSNKDKVYDWKQTTIINTFFHEFKYLLFALIRTEGSNKPKTYSFIDIYPSTMSYEYFLIFIPSHYNRKIIEQTYPNIAFNTYSYEENFESFVLTENMSLDFELIAIQHHDNDESTIVAGKIKYEDLNQNLAKQPGILDTNEKNNIEVEQIIDFLSRDELTKTKILFKIMQSDSHEY